MPRDTVDSYELDELDLKIIAALKAEGRATNQDIARSLKIAPATVSARIRRLEELNAMRVVAVTDFSALASAAWRTGQQLPLKATTQAIRTRDMRGR